MTIINVRDLGKKYLITPGVRSRNAFHYQTLRERIASSARGLLRSIPFASSQDRPKTGKVEFWALRDVNFDIQAGDRVGIIGRNGAGKSTLLKVLSRITEPSTGRIEINGRVACLLEVGTGFHPELTGRENIFLNGAILGMTRSEVRSSFDEIVDFAEIEEFLDTPVKRFSSGMYVRLAFAVAAHLRTEILIIDEVLAVGDVVFQKKCLGKMSSLSSKGRTILFVSHNMNAIEEICSRGLVLDRGRISLDSSDVREAVGFYLAASGEDGAPVAQWTEKDRAFRNPYFRPKRFYLSDSDGRTPALPIRNDSAIYVNVEFDADSLDPSLSFGFDVFDSNRLHVFACNQTDSPPDRWPHLRPGRNHVRTAIPPHFLNEGDYHLVLVASLFNREWLVNPFEDRVKIDLTIRGGLSESPYWAEKRGGVVAPVFPWETR